MRKLQQLFIFTLLAATLAACGSRQGLKGKTAPAFTFENIEGKKQSLADFKGKYVLLHFWTTSCRSCRKDFPKIEDYYSQMKGKDFELVAINVGEKLEASKKFKEKFSLSFPMLGDVQAVSEQIYQVDAYPTNIFISPEGKVIRTIVGPIIDKKQVEVIIQQHKKG
ncbi:TlpA family protein disulfide reductase [Microscilla marina]|uniref:Essential protein n=1 Tax=Microscilla marina ATCC 23134 TaxID=313606 RepID=A1ZM32_MICM2|nr:TlpA disulfide reductase family protein [Microscilla marina]EAY28564.1 essential protein [Microscilla marina ATCC 23134]